MLAENDDDDTVFMRKTRTLGTCIFSDGAAVAPAQEVQPLIELVQAEETEKANPGTGRF